MRTNIALVLVALALLAGCSSLPYSDPLASPDASSRTACERSGGYWHATPAVCERPRS
jgi:hypothetical protein